MLRAWWRRQSAGNKSPHSMNVRRRLPSSWAGIRDLCFDSGLSLIPPLLSHLIYFCLSSGIDFFHTDSRSYFNGCHFPYRGSPRNFLLRFLFSVCSFISTTPCVSFFSHDRLIHPGSVLMSVHETTGCSSKAPQHVAYVEHVVVRVNISHGRRGDLSITLTSPLGTTSQLLANR